MRNWELQSVILNVFVSIICIWSCFYYSGEQRWLLDSVATLIGLATLYNVYEYVGRKSPLYFAKVNNLVGILALIYFFLEFNWNFDALTNFFFGIVFCWLMIILINNYKNLW